MIEFVEINASESRKEKVEYLKSILSDIFKNTGLAQVALVFDCPFVGQDTKSIDMLILIRIPYKKGNFYKVNVNAKECWLNSLAFGIKQITDNSIIAANNLYLLSSDGVFDYKEAFKYDNYDFTIFGREALRGSFKCPIFYWYMSKSKESSFYNDKVFFGPTISIRYVINKVAEIYASNGRIACLPKVTNDFPLKDIASLLFDEAKRKNDPGFLTKKKLDLILKSKQTQDIIKICESHGKKMCIVSGKPGTGKTLTLIRVANLMAQDHHVRFLTYNQLLVKDIKRLFRTIGTYSSSSFSVRSLHQFFYELSHKMGILQDITREQLLFLMSICKARASTALKMIKKCQLNGYIIPEDPTELAQKADRLLDLNSSDLFEIGSFLKEYHYHKRTNPYEELTVEEYCNKKEERIKRALENDVYVQNYDLILQVLYELYDNPEQFKKDHNIRSIRDFVSVLSKMDESKIVTYTDKYYDDSLDVDFDPQSYIEKVKNKINWSNTLFIDEAQDCDYKEKYILMKLKGPESLIIATGGSDQLIRRAKEQNWSLCKGIRIPYESIKLYDQSFRQKGNIVEFVNAFCESFGIHSSIKVPPETVELGKVIIDIREYDGYPEEQIRLLIKSGEENRCSPCDSILFLLPHQGFTGTSLKEEQVTIDRHLYVDFQEEKYNYLSVMPTDKNIKIWDGTPPRKANLPVPSSDQTRFIYFDSCRGLEAWSVVCMNMDLFYEDKKNSNEALLYATKEELDVFMTEEEIKHYEKELMHRYAAMWCYMAMTRAISTLYIRLKYKSEFSEKVLSVARQLPFVQVLGDTLVERQANIIDGFSTLDHRYPLA